MAVLFRKCSVAKIEENHLPEKFVRHPFVSDVSLTEVDEDAVASFRAFSGLILRRYVTKLNAKLLR